MKFIYKVLLILPVLLFSQDWAGQPGSFLRMGMTARSISMGGGFTAELDQSFVQLHNPAWTAFLTKKYFGSSFNNLSLDRRIAATNISSFLPPTAGVGVSWINAGVTDIQGRTSSGEKSSVMQTSENILMVTFAQRIQPWLSVGANFKILKYDLPITTSDQISGSGIGFDLGFLVKSNEYITYGLVVQDLSSNYQWDTNAIFTQGGPYKDEFPVVYRLGSRFSNKGLKIIGDAGFITNHKTYFKFLPRLGVEYGLLEKYFFRGGYGNGRTAFGLGYQYALFSDNDSQIDYAFSLDWAVQTCHTISYAFNF